MKEKAFCSDPFWLFQGFALPMLLTRVFVLHWSLPCLSLSFNLTTNRATAAAQKASAAISLTIFIFPERCAIVDMDPPLARGASLKASYSV